MIDGFLALYIFMLAAFTGKEIISRVLVGAMVALAHADTTLGKVIGFIGVALGAGNAAGGYVVTERMLEMFKTSKDKK